MGFLVPVLAVLSGVADLPRAAGPAVLLAAGAAEGALLGTAQASVLAREVPGLSRGTGSCAPRRPPCSPG